jgi:RNA polymerase sigma-70 factor (ECF subfamily)
VIALKPESGTNPFDRLLAPQLPVLYRVAYRLVRNNADAEDLVQESCLAACEHIADLQAADQPLHWLLRVLHNRFIDGARRRKRSPVVAPGDSPDTLSTPSQAPGPEDLLSQADGERRLEQAFLQLDEVQRTLLALRAEGHDLGEIAAITGIAREVLRARLHRARRSLAARLNEPMEVTTPVVRAGSKP